MNCGVIILQCLIHNRQTVLSLSLYVCRLNEMDDNTSQHWFNTNHVDQNVSPSRSKM